MEDQKTCQQSCEEVVPLGRGRRKADEDEDT